MRAELDASSKQIEELQTQLRDAEHSQATAAEQVTQLTAQTAQANEQITRSFTETQQADKDVVELNKQLDSARAAHTEMAQRAQRTTQECERMAATLEQTKKQSQAVGAMQAERSAWYEQVTMQISALSGIRGASMHEGGLLHQCTLTSAPEPNEILWGNLELDGWYELKATLVTYAVCALRFNGPGVK